MKARHQGFILVQVLIVVAVLVAFMMMMLANQRAVLQNTQDRLRQRRAEIAARSGVAYAVSVLQAATPALATLNDTWATLDDTGQTAFQMDDATIRMQIVDAGALININSATTAQLQQLPLTQEQIDCLLDWREPGQTPRPDGAKDTYYNGLDQPYNTRLGNLATLDELMLIKGWTANDVYAVPTTTTVTSPIQPQDAKGNIIPLAGLLTVASRAPNTRADGSPRINFATRLTPVVLTRLGITGLQAAQIAARSPFTSFRALLGQPGLPTNVIRILLNVATFSTATELTDKININTASVDVLRSLPNMPANIASAIVSQQSTGFTSMGDLTTVPGLNGNLLAQIADSLTVGSDEWIIRVYGESGGVGYAAEVLVTLTNGAIQIQSWSPVHGVGLPAWWVWDAQPATTTQLGTGT